MRGKREMGVVGGLGMGVVVSNNHHPCNGCELLPKYYSDIAGRWRGGEQGLDYGKVRVLQ